MLNSGYLPCARIRRTSLTTVAGVIKRFAPAYFERYGEELFLDERRALQAMLQCRTEVLGGHEYDCSCGHKHYAYHSCNNRLCPTCGSEGTQDWVKKQLVKLLPVKYFMVTFTLPSQLRKVIGGNRKALELLMSCSAKALTELLADPQRCGFSRSGFFGVYQSWRQDMEFHPHVHYLVPAVGLDVDRNLKHLHEPKFLIHGKVLAMRLRTLLMNALYGAGLIRKSLFWKLVKMSWNASVDAAGSGENAVKYFGQYVCRSVISDSRIVSVKGDEVTIRVKNRDTGKFELRPMSGVEFVRRFLQHALPSGFHRIRYRGFLHARGKKSLEILQFALKARLSRKEKETPESPREVRCPHCGKVMSRMGRFARAPPKRRNQDFFQRVAA